jgi:hypothetical protein
MDAPSEGIKWAIRTRWLCGARSKKGLRFQAQPSCDAAWTALCHRWYRRAVRRSLPRLVLASALAASCQTSALPPAAAGRADAAADALATDLGPDTLVASVLEDCARLCATTEPLHCPVPPPPGEACAVGCATSAETIIQCRAATAALLRCLAPRPLSDWYCDADGKVTSKDGVCAAEKAAADPLQCLRGP